VKRVTRECDSATRIRGIGKRTPKKPMQLDLGLVRAAPKSAKTAKTNATRPRPGPGGAEIRKDR